jgi:hypothetical protein
MRLRKHFLQPTDERFSRITGAGEAKFRVGDVCSIFIEVIKETVNSVTKRTAFGFPPDSLKLAYGTPKYVPVSRRQDDSRKGEYFCPHHGMSSGAFYGTTNRKAFQ